jgi:2-polyprenyl-3-methyl-5-hydroxy-6-metoxy-1,4-benzoquinol methylase
MMICNICNKKLYILNKQKYSFFKCENCKSIYKAFSILNDYSTNSEDYNKITNEDYFNQNVMSFTNNPIMEIIKIYATDKSKILDIGCSNGAFLKALKSNNINNVFGIDIQKDTIEFAKKHNLQCFYGLFPNKIPKELEQKYNIITSFENIYYMPNLIDFFEKAIDLLEKNGKLVLKFNQSSSSYYIKYPYHIRVVDFNVFINIETIIFLANKYKLNILDVKAFNSSYISDYFGYSSWKTKPKKEKNFFLKVFDKLSGYVIPIKYADKIIVVLEKK